MFAVWDRDRVEVSVITRVVLAGTIYGPSL